MILLCTVLSGCVGGPGSYFEQVSRETKLENQRIGAAKAANKQDLSVQQNDLTSLVNSQDQALAEDQTRAQDMNSDIDLQEQPTSIASVANNDMLAPSGDLKFVEADQTQSSPSNPDEPLSLSSGFLGSEIVPQSQTQERYASDQLALLPNTNDPSTAFIIGSQSTPWTNPQDIAAEQRIPQLYARIKHGQCKQGLGPKPKKISASDIRPGDPYYIDIRMRKTPLLPVGHTYVAYGRLSADGGIVDEKLIMLAPYGGYAGAALASGVPMPGILEPHRDDCRIRPETAYRVSLSASRYEKLLLEIERAKSETQFYLLFANNCNHFMTRIAKSVGLKPPRNIYVPALEYIYAMIENNEGRKISRR